MLEDHRAGPKHDSLLKAHHDDDSDSSWMVSYIDVMTLLVALFVIIIVAAEAADPGWLTRAAEQDAEPEAVARPVAQPAVPGVPLPPELAARLRPAVAPGTLAPGAISAALGVAGLPAKRRLPEPPPLLALAQSTESAAPEPSTTSHGPLLPELLVAGRDVPLAAAMAAEYMVVLTDAPPANAVPVAAASVSSEALEGARMLSDALAERQQDAPYLPDLEGVEATRVSEGINLRVQNKLLFESAEAGLSAPGEALVASLVETIQRYEGDVSVEGHSDSRSINTEEYPSNWALSSARAIAIVQALEDAGVAPGRLRAVGLAATRPLADNDTPEGRARNRRVEVVIHVE